MDLKAVEKLISAHFQIKKYLNFPGNRKFNFLTVVIIIRYY